MTLDLFNGSQDACGLTTSGGTESILLAMLSYREWGKKRGITKPNIVASNTAHAAFDKACFYFGIELRKVPSIDFEIDLKGIRNNIDSNTVCLIASCPDFALGKYDPVPIIATLALEHGINCHSDCCLGSYINPFTEAAGFEVPCKYDFSVEGVTSISADPHKFCYGPKGLSVVMFRTKELRRNSFFALTEWPGGMYLTPTIAGSRAGSVIAGTWAALMKQGKEGFVEKAKLLLGAAKRMRENIAKIDGIRVISFDATTVVSFTHTKVNCIALNDIMFKRHKWSLSSL